MTKIITLLILTLTIMPINAQNEELSINKEKQVFNDHDARYFLHQNYNNKSHPLALSVEQSLELAKENGKYNKAWFDVNNRLLRCEMRNYQDEDNLEAALEYEYNTKGSITRIRFFDENNNLEKHFQHEYDLKGRCSRSNYFNKYNNLIEDTEYEYNSKGNKTTTKYFDENNNVIKTKIYEYAPKGPIIRIKCLDKNNNIEKEEHIKISFLEKIGYRLAHFIFGK